MWYNLTVRVSEPDGERSDLQGVTNGVIYVGHSISRKGLVLLSGKEVFLWN
jgi:hypothetical protein